jgi:hypothetical protein
MEDIFQLAGDEKKTTTSCIGFLVRRLTKKITSIPPYLHTPYSIRISNHKTNESRAKEKEGTRQMDYIDRWISETIREPTLMTAGQVLTAVSPYYNTGLPLTQAKLGRDLAKKSNVSKKKTWVHILYSITPIALQTDTPPTTTPDHILPCVMTTAQFEESPYSTCVRKMNGTAIDLRGHAGIYIYKDSAGRYAYRRVRTIVV